MYGQTMSIHIHVQEKIIQNICFKCKLNNILIGFHDKVVTKFVTVDQHSTWVSIKLYTKENITITLINYLCNLLFLQST